MSEIGFILILFAVGVVLLLGDIMIPSHGLLTVVAIACFVGGVVKAFDHGGREGGILAIAACVIFLPSFAFFAVKYWPHTPIGRLIAPPNPQLTSDDTGIPIDELRALRGRTGQSISPLRPVGICEFSGRRYSCVAESGMVDAGERVVGIGIKNGTLEVRVTDGGPPVRRA